MIPANPTNLKDIAACPHTRGDDPQKYGRKLSGIELVPIRVGMILPAYRQTTYLCSCPHTRGDDPSHGERGQPLQDLSPYAWG